MQIDHEINHLNIMTHDMDRMAKFYGEVLGFKVGWRPDFPSKGAWMYLGDKPLIHLVEIEQERRSIEPRVSHFAFTGTGILEFADNLKRLDIPFATRSVPNSELVQVVLLDPDGNVFEILFDNAASAGVTAYKWEGPIPV